MYIGILGGSFNPLHIGHIRLALEALESPFMPQPLARVDLVPCAQPPHKAAHNILPFSLRLEILRAAVRDIPKIQVNDLEGRRQGPSYTWDTLEAYAHTEPGARLLFLVGGEDFAAIPQWHRGKELPCLADIAMVPRAGFDTNMFRRETARHWPEAELCEDKGLLWAEFPGGSRLLYLPLPRLDISASYLRARWMAGGDVRFLLPHTALEVLNNNQQAVMACWSQPEA